MVEMLQRTSAAGPEMPAARLHAIGRGSQHFDDHGLVVAPPPPQALEPHRLAGKRAVHEHGLAADARDAAPVVVQRLDVRDFHRGQSFQGPAQAAAYCRQWASPRSASQARTRATSAAYSTGVSMPRINSNRSQTR